jgi:hypothetical protein
MTQSRLLFYSGVEHRVGRCAECRGFRKLCGKLVCVILIKAKSSVELDKILKKDVFDSLPPGVFVGIRGYPKVLAGPLIPPIVGEETARAIWRSVLPAPAFVKAILSSF